MIVKRVEISLLFSVISFPFLLLLPFSVGLRRSETAAQKNLLGSTCFFLDLEVTGGSGQVPIATPSNCDGGGYLPGTLVKLTARPASGNKVHRWQGTTYTLVDTLNNQVLIDTDKIVKVAYIPEGDPYTTVPWGSSIEGRKSMGFYPQPNSIIPPEDERERILDTTISPYRKVAHLEMNFGEHGVDTCTGWFIGPLTVITAGHCLFDREYMSWSEQVKVIPARDETDEPLGFEMVIANANNVFSTKGWVDYGYADYDLGAIILPDSTLGNLSGWFNFGYFSNNYLSLLENLTLTGYPHDKDPEYSMWTSIGNLTHIDNQMVLYDMDTYHGQSGSPIYFASDSTFTTIAIHAYGYPCLGEDSNCGPKINKSVADLFELWGAAETVQTDCSVIGTPDLTSPSDNFQVYINPVTFDWEPVPLVDAYRMRLYNYDTSTLVIDEIITRSQYTIHGLNIGTYDWQVSAQNVAGCPAGDYSETRLFTISNADTPTNVQASDGLFSDRITINSDPVNNATEYYLWRSIDGEGSWVYRKMSTTPNFVESASETTANQVYYYRLQACNDYGCSQDSIPDPGWRALISPIYFPIITY